MLRPAGPPVHDTLLPGEHRVLRGRSTSTSVLYLSVFSTEIVRFAGGRRPRIRVFHARRVTAKEKVSDKKGEGNEHRSVLEEGGGETWRGGREGVKCSWVREGCTVQFPRARDAI